MREQTISDIKKIIHEYFPIADCGIFNTPGSDEKCEIYRNNKEGVTVLFCPNYSYFDVLGLEEDEWHEIDEYYNELNKKKLLKF